MPFHSPYVRPDHGFHHRHAYTGIRRRAFKELQRFRLIDLYINPVQISQTDKKPVPCGTVIFLFRDPDQSIQQRPIQFRTKVLVPKIRDILILEFCVSFSSRCGVTAMANRELF